MLPVSWGRGIRSVAQAAVPQCLAGGSSVPAVGLGRGGLGARLDRA